MSYSLDSQILCRKYRAPQPRASAPKTGRMFLSSRNAYWRSAFFSAVCENRCNHFRVQEAHVKKHVRGTHEIHKHVCMDVMLRFNDSSLEYC